MSLHEVCIDIEGRIALNLIGELQIIKDTVVWWGGIRSKGPDSISSAGSEFVWGIKGGWGYLQIVAVADVKEFIHIKGYWAVQGSNKIGFVLIKFILIIILKLSIVKAQRIGKLCCGKEVIQLKVGKHSVAVSFEFYIKGINTVGNAAVVTADIPCESGPGASVEWLLQIQVGIEDIAVDIQITVISAKLIAWIG